MSQDPLARRAAKLPTSLPAAHFPGEFESGVISFSSGFAFPPLLPDLEAVAVEALTKHRAETLQYSSRQGLKELRDWIAGYLKSDGCEVDPDDLMLVNGAKHGIDLICRLLLDEGDAIVVTAPTYFTAIPIFKSFGVEFIEVSQDAQGMRVDELEEMLADRRGKGRVTPKFIYDVPDFHNPSGATLPLERRKALLELAERHGIYVVEDSPYRKVRFEGQAVPSLLALDRSNRVIHVGTFAKLIAPGLRVGWVHARRDLLARLLQLKSDGGSSPLLHRIVLEFCKSPEFELHSNKVRAIYREHRDRMIAALERNFPEARFLKPEGGYYIWLTLPAAVNTDVLAARLSEQHVHVIPGGKFYANPGDRGHNRLRLVFSFPNPEDIDEGIDKLARATRSLLA